MAKLNSTTIYGRLDISGQVVSSVASGTPPFVISSTTVVPNLNATYLNGSTSGAFAALSHNQAVLNGTASTYPSFYAATNAAGVANAILLGSTNGAPVWSSTAVGTAAYQASTAFQAYNAGLADLASLAPLTTPGFIKLDGANNFILDSSSYTTSSGVTSIATSGAITGGTITSTGTISHSTDAGYIHIPSGGTTSQILQYAGSSGTAQWYTPPWTTNTGTVTSVAMTVPTGLSISGSPITTSGTLALTLTTGYTIPSTTAMANAATAYGWGDHSGLYLPLDGSGTMAGNLDIGGYTISGVGHITNANTGYWINAIGSITISAPLLTLNSVSLAMVINNYGATISVPTIAGTINIADTTTTASRILLSTSTAGQAVWSTTTIGTAAYQASTAFAASSHNQAVFNGSASTYPSFYAPTTGGTSTIYLLQGAASGAPTWTTSPSITSLTTSGVITSGGTLSVGTGSAIWTLNGSSTTVFTFTYSSSTVSLLPIAGTINISNTTITASRLLLSSTTAGYSTWSSTSVGAAAYYGVTDSTSASAISTGTSLPTERDIYYGLPTINNSHSYNSSTTVYGPTAGGTTGYILVGAGTTTAPTWSLKLAPVISVSTTATISTATYSNAIYFLGGTGNFTVTVSTTAMSTGCDIKFIKTSSSTITVTISVGSSGYMNGTLNGSASITTQNSHKHLVNTSATTWYCI